jgi:hypothetical protein
MIEGKREEGWTPRERWFRLRARTITRPKHDDFADALPISLGSVTPATNRFATTEPGELARLRNSSPTLLRTVWFRLPVSAPTDVYIDACNGLRPSVIVATGSTVRRLNSVPTFYYDRAAEGEHCGAQFTAKPGVYSIAAGVVLETLEPLGGQGGGKFKLRARPITRPPNDDFANATPISLGTRTAATTQYATFEHDEHGFSDGESRSIWFKLAVGSPTEIVLDACNGSSPELGVYRGESLASLAYVPSPSPSDYRCSYQWPATAGTYYIVARDFANENAGSFTLLASPATQ